MQTNVTLKTRSLYTPNEAVFNAECKAINANYDLELEYDGRDVKITFPLYSKIELTKWCQLILGLFNKKSNFKQLLFKTFSFMRCKKKLEYIFFEVQGDTICVEEHSNPYELMRDHYRKLGNVVLENDTEELIRDRNSRLLRFNVFIYQIFLERTSNSDSKNGWQSIVFLSGDEGIDYWRKESQKSYKEYQEFLRDFELDSKSSDESKELLIWLKEMLLH